MSNERQFTMRQQSTTKLFLLYHSHPHMNTQVRGHTETRIESSPKVTTITYIGSSHDRKSQQLEIMGSYHGFQSMAEK